MPADRQQIVDLIPQLRRYAIALAGDRGQAEDLVQDCLERALSRLALWRAGSNLRAWLFSILHNVFIDSRRKGGGTKMLSLESESFEFPIPPGQEQRVEVTHVGAALERLPDDQREVLLLVALEEMSYEEVAQTLGIPIGTVMSRLHRGRERLRLLMAGGSAGPTLRRVK